MALRACNNPQITGPVLSREITKLVISHAEAEVGRLLQKRKADAVGELISFARDDGGIGEAGGGGASKRQRCNGGTATEVSPISEAEETQEKPEREASLLRERGRTGDAARDAPARRIRARSALRRGDVRGARLRSAAPGRSAPPGEETSSQRFAGPAVRAPTRHPARGRTRRRTGAAAGTPVAARRGRLR